MTIGVGFINADIGRKGEIFSFPFGKRLHADIFPIHASLEYSPLKTIEILTARG